MKESEFLIILISKETKNSNWVSREFSWFLESHDLDHVIPILLEGNPLEELPKKLLQSGDYLIVNIHGKNFKEVLKNLNHSFFDIMAPLLHCEKDDLIQRISKYKRMVLYIYICIALFVVSLFGWDAKRIYELNNSLKASMLTQEESIELIDIYELNPNKESFIANKAVFYALSQVGKKYLWGGEGPDGFDCSGLVYKAYQNAGKSIPRTTFAQISTGASIDSLSCALPGDLLFFDILAGVQPSYVGIYIGNGMMVHAGTSSTGIIICDITTPYWQKKLYGIRRVV